MPWIAPKVDWVPGDGIAQTDLNRIEGNTLYNYDTAIANDIQIRRRYEVSSRMADAEGGFAAGQQVAMQRIGLVLEDDEVLILKAARYSFAIASFKMRIYYDIGAGLVLAWTSGSNEDDEEPNDTILSNTTGAQVSGFISIYAWNDGGGGSVAESEDGWSLTFEKEDVAVHGTSTTTVAP